MAQRTQSSSPDLIAKQCSRCKLLFDSRSTDAAVTSICLLPQSCWLRKRSHRRTTSPQCCSTLPFPSPILRRRSQGACQNMSKLQVATICPRPRYFWSPAWRTDDHDGCGVDDAGRGWTDHGASFMLRCCLGGARGERMDWMGDRVSPNKGLEVGQHCGRLSFDGTTVCVCGAVTLYISLH